MAHDLAGSAALASHVFDAVMFDLDGTLISSVPVVDKAWRQLAAEYGFADPATFTPIHGAPARTTLTTVLPADQVDGAYDRILALEMGDQTGVVALTGAAQALTALGPRAAIVTSCPRELALRRLAAAGLTAPDVLVTVDDITHGKPHPEPFLLGAQRLGVDPARCLAVEDAEAGIASARAAGCTVLAVEGTHPAADIIVLPTPPHAVVRGLDEVVFDVGHTAGKDGAPGFGGGIRVRLR